MSRKVLITGANRGLGNCLSKVFFDKGDEVFVHCGRSDGDLSDPKTIEKLSFIAEENDIDVLINNAGVYENKWLMDTPPDKFREIIEVNLIAPILLTQAMWPIFKEKKSGLGFSSF